MGRGTAGEKNRRRKRSGPGAGPKRWPAQNRPGESQTCPKPVRRRVQDGRLGYLYCTNKSARGCGDKSVVSSPSALAANTDLEKRLAVTEAKREALEATERTRAGEAKERIEELKQELSGIKIALEEERKGRVEAEKQLAGREPGQQRKETKGK